MKGKIKKKKISGGLNLESIFFYIEFERQHLKNSPKKKG